MLLFCLLLHAACQDSSTRDGIEKDRPAAGVVVVLEGNPVLNFTLGNHIVAPVIS